MRKKISIISSIICILLIAILTLFNKKSDKLEKIKVADTTLTSWSCG